MCTTGSWESLLQRCGHLSELLPITSFYLSKSKKLTPGDSEQLLKKLGDF